MEHHTCCIGRIDITPHTSTFHPIQVSSCMLCLNTFNIFEVHFHTTILSSINDDDIRCLHFNPPILVKKIKLAEILSHYSESSIDETPVEISHILWLQN